MPLASTPFVITGDLCDALGVQLWRIARLFELGVLPESSHIGGRRLIPKSMIPEIVDALRSRGWLPESAEVAAGGRRTKCSIIDLAPRKPGLTGVGQGMVPRKASYLSVRGSIPRGSIVQERQTPGALPRKTSYAMKDTIMHGGKQAVDAVVPVLLKLKETAALCSVSDRTLWSWATSGIIPAPVRIGKSTVRYFRPAYLAWTVGMLQTGLSCRDGSWKTPASKECWAELTIV